MNHLESKSFSTKKNCFMVINITTLGQERPWIWRFRHAKKTCVSLETWQLPLPKNSLPLVMFLVGEFLIAPPKILPMPRNLAPFRSVPKVLNLGGQGSQGCESAHKANFQKPYAIFFLGFCCYLGLILFFFCGGRGPKPKSNDTMFLGLLCSSCVFCWSKCGFSR